jgi:hypothetical protein
MGMTPELSRLAKMLIDAEGLTMAEAEERLQALTLEIVVGHDTQTQAAHNAVLTALAVGQRTFAGGVSVLIAEDSALHSELPIAASSLCDATRLLGAIDHISMPSARIAIGAFSEQPQADAFAWWGAWTAGSNSKPRECDGGENPLTGIVAGAACVARAFASVRGAAYPADSTFDLWPSDENNYPPPFKSVFMPGEIWILGVGNLGQAILWSMSSLPYAEPKEIKIVLQDRDRIYAENWGTSILVRRDEYGAYKTAVGEAWCKARGFDVRRVDRWLDENQRTQKGEPRLALCGFDSVEARMAFDASGFDIVIDAGLGRSHKDFERFRITVFDKDFLASNHFADQVSEVGPNPQDYEKLLGMDGCGAAIFRQVAIAAPYVSAITGAMVVARSMAISSGVGVPRNEVRRLAEDDVRRSRIAKIGTRGLVRVKQA